jgi:hypothetical protein
VLVQLSGLPSIASDALVKRQAVFGEGCGLLSFRLGEAAELVSIVDISWIGQAPCGGSAARR